jgi:hypothetical protein
VTKFDPQIRVVNNYRPPVTTQVDYSMADVVEAAEHAYRNKIWYFVQDSARSPRYSVGEILVETMVLIAAPDARVCVCYGHWRRRPLPMPPTERSEAPGTVAVEPMVAAMAAAGYAIGQWWSGRDSTYVRDPRPLAEAAARVLHAKTFDEKPVERDEYLAEWLERRPRLRPSTKQLLNARNDTLAAASAALHADKFDFAAMLIRTQKQPVKIVKYRPKRSRAVMAAVLEKTS